MKNKKLWLIIVAMLMSALAVGCKEIEESIGKLHEEIENVSQMGDKEAAGDTEDSETDANSDESETTYNKDDAKENSAATEGDVTGESDKAETDTATKTEDSTEGESETATKTEDTTKSETGTTTKTETVTTTKTETTTTTKTETTTTTKATTTQTTTTKTPTSSSDTNVNYGPVINKGSQDYIERYSKRGVDSTQIAKAESILNSILKTSMSEVERVRAIHDWLVKNVQYDYDTADNMNGVMGNEPAFSATGSLINGLAVCEGYSEGFLLLCWTAGIDAMLVEGTGDGGGHEWNVVNIDGSWYQVDVTWDDPTITGDDEVDYAAGENLRYDYFLITTADMQKDHVITGCFDYDSDSRFVAAPSCTSTAFYDYAEKCTFEHKLDGSEYVIVSSYDEITNATKTYLSKGITAFKIVYTIGTLNESTALSTMGQAAANYYGAGVRYSSYQAVNANGYTIIEILSITKG